MKTTTIWIAVVLIIATGLLLILASAQEKKEAPVITNFDECVAAGNPILESYPEQCNTKDGLHFVNERQVVQVPNLPEGNIVPNDCVVAGCSSQLCVSAEEAENIFTTCEFRAEYACYQTARCEPQSEGKCGWTQTPELEQCLANLPAQAGPPSLESDAEPQAI